MKRYSKEEVIKLLDKCKLPEREIVSRSEFRRIFIQHNGRIEEIKKGLEQWVRNNKVKK